MERESETPPDPMLVLRLKRGNDELFRPVLPLSAAARRLLGHINSNAPMPANRLFRFVRLGELDANLAELTHYGLVKFVSTEPDPTLESKSFNTSVISPIAPDVLSKVRRAAFSSLQFQVGGDRAEGLAKTLLQATTQDTLLLALGEIQRAIYDQEGRAGAHIFFESVVAPAYCPDIVDDGAPGNSESC